MPPEQAEGRAVDQRSDLYSLGAVLFEMLTGKLPFEGRTALDLAIKHKTAAPPDPKTINPHIPAEVSRLVLKCLEKEAPARYQTALELISDLDRIEGANPARPRSAIPAMSRKAKAVFGILGVAILIAVLLPVIKPRGRAGELPVSGMATDLLTTTIIGASESRRGSAGLPGAGLEWPISPEASRWNRGSRHGMPEMSRRE